MPDSLSQLRLLQLYVPLAFNSILMMIEMPVVTAGISRLPEPELNLAGYGIIVAVTFTLQNLIVPLTHTGNALGRSRHSFYLLRKFSFVMCLLMALISIIIYYTPVYDWLVIGLLAVPEHVARHAQPGVQLMVAAGFAIGWRRFYHGVLIRHGFTGIVGWITIIRAAALLIVTYSLVTANSVTGIVMAGYALTISASIESLVVTVVAEWVLQRSRRVRWASSHSFRLTYGQALRFFLPLALVLVLNNGVRPLITSAMTRLPEPVLSLATFPVAYGVFHLVYLPVSVLTQMVIAYVRDQASHTAMRRFIPTVCLLAWAGLLLASFTPVIDFYLSAILGVPEDVRVAAVPAVRILSLYIVLAIFQVRYQGLLVAARRTSSTQLATFLNVGAACVTLLIGYFIGTIPGVILGCIAYVVGFAVETLALRRLAGSIIRALPDTEEQA